MSGMPTLTDTGQRLYDAVAPLAQQDAENGYALANYCAALAAMLDQVTNLVRDPDAGSTGTPGWAKLFDIDNVDPVWLPWLAQFVGVDLTYVSDTTSRRALIKAPVGYQRGTVAAMKQAAKVTLTGTQTVLINERAGSDPWKMTASTYTSETPNPTRTLNALLSMKPAGVILTYTTVTGGTYAQLATSHATYSAMEAPHTTYSDIPANPGA